MQEQISTPVDVDSAYLQVELQRVRTRLQQAVARWRLAGQDPNDAFRGLYVSDEEAEALLARPLSTNWGQTVSLPEEIEASLERQSALVERQAEAILDGATERGTTPALERLRIAFGLSQFELDVLLICLAPSIDLRYERIYSYLQDDVTKKRPTVNMVLDLLTEGGIGRLAMLAHFEDDAPLFRNHLLELRQPAESGPVPLLARVLTVDDGLLVWLLGGYRPHSDLAGYITLDPDPASGLDPLVDAALARELVTGVAAPLYLFHGQDHDGQHAAARLLAAATHRPLLVLDVAGILGRDDYGSDMRGPIGARRAIRLALRDARLMEALPMLSGWDACLVEGNTPPVLLRELYAFPGPAIVAGKALWQPKGGRAAAFSPSEGGTPEQRIVIEVAFPVPPYEQRLRLWQHFIGPDGIEDDGIEGDAGAVDALAGQFMLTSGQIRDAVATAKDRAVRRGVALSREALFAAARAHSNAHLATLAHKIMPKYRWDDIVLPEDQKVLLQEIIDTVRGRSQVLDMWGVGDKLASSRGVTVLFSGPPGTGKTMAAEIIAGGLGLDLYRIDLSTIVSKYIGETEKNIERIFQEAEQSNAILFFDEADALFGKRSEVRDSHDRYANIEISYLLQRMEAYDGVTILATNLRGNLDEAFTRRLQFAVTFPFPEAEDRLRIWTTLFPPNVPRSQEIDFGFLAERFRLAGGNIRNVIISAAYLAAADGGAVTMGHLLHGTRRELQKMGRLVREEDLVVDREEL